MGGCISKESTHIKALQAKSPSHSWGSITTGYCGPDLKLCWQSDVGNTSHPALVNPKDNLQIPTLSLTVKPHHICCCHCFYLFFWFFSLESDVNCVIRPKPELSLISQRRRQKTCVFCSLLLRLTDINKSHGLTDWLSFEWHPQTVWLSD